MKILLVLDQFDDDNNGTTMTARRLANTLVKHGHEVSVISTGKASENKYVVEEYFLPPIVRHIVKGQGMTFGKPDSDLMRQAMANVDIVHFVMPLYLSIKGLAIAKELGVPHTAAFHVQPENITYTLGLGKNDKVNYRLYQFFRKHFFDEFKHVHCPSQFIANQLVENGYQAKLHVISNGVAESFVYRKMDKTNNLQGKFVVLMIGRYSNEKRQDLLIEAIGLSKYKERIQLILAGQGLKHHVYEKLGKKLPNPPILQFYPHEALLEVLAMSDLYVHAADAEIEAISCIEAFSSGLVPVIANSLKSATPQFALEDNNLFEAGNAQDLADHIDYWYEHEKERKALELRYSEYGKKFSLDYCVTKMEEMFHEAIYDNEN